MNCKKTVVLSLALVITFTTVIFFLLTTYSLLDSKNNIIVYHKDYGFKFSYPKKWDLPNIDEWDNGLPGSADGGVYGYSASGDYAGNFTEKIYFEIYNKSLEEYLSKYKKNSPSFEITEIKAFGKLGIKITNEKQVTEDLKKSWIGGLFYCKNILNTTISFTS